MCLQGKVALVTGAANDRSIGWGIARALAEEGADIVVNDVNQPDELQRRAEDVRAMGRRSSPIQADVSNPEQVEAMIQRTVAELGRLDIVASNAGVINWEPFLTITPAKLQRIMNVNIKGNVYICQAAARQMIKQEQGGRIIITSSVQSDMQFPVSPVYGASKKAMHTFVGALALELAQYNITVNHIGPGWVRSALNDPAPGQQTAAELEAQRQAVPLKRDGSIHEMGRAVVYFASDDGAYTTGAFIRVDGGLGISKYSY
jgi:meso-butanediol dehydrogenase / (S,S)-butanediol dehydrogenase / diacetyl reductase